MKGCEHMNIDFIKDNFKFNARVSALIFNKNKDKILLFKIEDGRDYYMLPGGRIELFEDSKSAIKREIKEELGYDINFDLCSIQENFLEKNNVKITQYCFCYKGIYDGEIIREKFVCLDNHSQYFYWIDLDKINDYKIFPKLTYNLINNNKIKHIIEKDLGD